MKNAAMYIFFLIVSAVFFLVSWYVFSRGMLALKNISYRYIFVWTFWLISAAFIVGQILERGEPSLIARIITHIGSVWLSLFLYLFLFVIIADLVRLADYFFPFFPSNLGGRYTSGQIIFFTGLFISLAITVYGYFNARYPRVNTVNIEVRKSAGDIKNLRVVMASDIHMGAMIGNKRVGEMIETINSLEPDIVIFAGDLVDHNPLYVRKYDMGENFRKIKSKYGVFAVAGNHEFIGDAEKSISYLRGFGVNYLRDTIIDVAGVFLLAGRDDKDKVRFAGKKRKELNEIISGADKSKLLILADHQPVDYSQAEELGVDLMLSGHTHKGQLWPFNFITNAVYGNDYGLVKNGDTYFYTSSGFGTWGPPVRTGNRPEIVVIDIEFTGK